MIAIDVMGGDNAPEVVLQGALAAAKKYIPVALYGPQGMIRQWLTCNDPSWECLSITVVDASEIVAMDEEPVLAVRKKPASSLVKAVASVAAGQSVAVLSAGNSGALMAAAALIIGRCAGVERPAIAGFLPTPQGRTLILDLGANTECRPAHLQTFAHLGNDYVHRTLGITNPRIGLLSNGHEEGKGSMLVKETYALLKLDSLNFIGNVEPYDVFTHKADVVVCDGFSGNVLLKTMESVTQMITGLIDPQAAQAVAMHFSSGLLSGALLLGVNGSVIVCHGSADAHAIENAISFAWTVSGKKIKREKELMVE